MAITSGTKAEKKVGRAAQIAAPNTALQMVQLEYPSPESRQIRLKVQACGICHSDSFPFHGHFPGIKYPIVPGHEIVGIVDEVGANVQRLKKGDRVGVGWHSGHCHECKSCRRGDFISCTQLQVAGISVNGGYEEYAIFPEEVCALVPDEIDSAQAAPLMCAGVTTFNSLRHAGATAGDTVAILGIGGLGHLGIQFANKMGFRTVAIARGNDKAEFAAQLGAHHYINSQDENAIQQLIDLGGAKVLLSTIIDSDSMTPWINALDIDGRMVLVGADVKPMAISPISLIGGRRSVIGWPSGTAKDSEDCLKFAALTGVRPMIESFHFEKAADAYNRMMSGKARFRVVIEFD